jgi:hypothetical protein
MHERVEAKLAERVFAEPVRGEQRSEREHASPGEIFRERKEILGIPASTVKEERGTRALARKGVARLRPGAWLCSGAFIRPTEKRPLSRRDARVCFRAIPGANQARERGRHEVRVGTNQPLDKRRARKSAPFVEGSPRIAVRGSNLTRLNEVGARTIRSVHRRVGDERPNRI